MLSGSSLVLRGRPTEMHINRSNRGAMPGIDHRGLGAVTLGQDKRSVTDIILGADPGAVMAKLDTITMLLIVGTAASLAAALATFLYRPRSR